MKEHFVIAFVDHTKRNFNTTARKKNARLKQVEQQCRRLGYQSNILATQLDKSTADAMKVSIDAAYEAAGYRYIPRPPLP